MVASYPFGTADHADDSITWAKIQNMAASRILGRITAGAGDIEELTGTQLTTMLDLFTSVLKGLVPASGGGTANFLRADGTWAAPGGGTARESLVAQWSQSITKTNIGTAFVNIYNQTNADGKSVSIDTNGKTEARLSVNWNKIGAGTQTVQVIDVVGSVVLISMNVVSGYNETALTAIPASLLNTVKRYNLRAKSTTAADDPIFEGAAIYLK